ncbi:N-6 DNA methylase [Aerococcus kribbianus]|uniref:site-specific DNA-methyltransferase (adenine-specific) n=1 Tax=Aerococcus kribbianus TaxID=2999064 RepID=A0A9X3FV58_9LACT|nr:MULTISPECIES: N-6 DNA methylase [unclassified Aerococcus]MCZ0716819.1 N-6 DNA methylase [Aerococcus sp. YH-aer221]MCZ0725107.1 N-6 DNA methylase [Aerococcus sp. YH-aer222]
MNKIKKLIKSNDRVKQHGEVFTPDWMVQKMLDIPEIKNATESYTKTFLEPAAGDGNFLVAILERKLASVKKEFLNKTLIEYESHALYALSTLYGIELLEDNAQMCAMNLATTFQKEYLEVVQLFHGEANDDVIKSANYIISKNIVNGNFLTRKDRIGDPITFTEWEVCEVTPLGELVVSQTDYTLDEIYDNADHQKGTMNDYPKFYEEYDLFADYDFGEEIDVSFDKYGYAEVVISKVYKEEIEYYDN